MWEIERKISHNSSSAADTTFHLTSWIKPIQMVDAVNGLNIPNSYQLKANHKLQWTSYMYATSHSVSLSNSLIPLHQHNFNCTLWHIGVYFEKASSASNDANWVIIRFLDKFMYICLLTTAPLTIRLSILYFKFSCRFHSFPRQTIRYLMNFDVTILSMA